MGSSENKLPQDGDADKVEVIANVRLRRGDERVIRRAAAETDTSRSRFMAIASIEKARAILEAVGDAA